MSIFFSNKIFLFYPENIWINFTNFKWVFFSCGWVLSTNEKNIKALILRTQNVLPNFLLEIYGKPWGDPWGGTRTSMYALIRVRGSPSGIPLSAPGKNNVRRTRRWLQFWCLYKSWARSKQNTWRKIYYSGHIHVKLQVLMSPTNFYTKQNFFLIPNFASFENY